LVKKYDVIIDQFRPRVLDRLGISHEKMREANPRLIVCALTGYGQEGPLSQRAGHDLNYLARAGILGFQGPPGAPPALPGFQLADIGGALWSVIGILAALAERARTGEGSIVDISMMEAAMGFAAISFGMMTGGVTPKRGDEALTGAIAPYGTYATKDERAVTLGALEPKFWTAFCMGVGMEAEMSALMPGPHQIALKTRVAEIFRSRTLAEWTTFGAEVDCCLEPVLLPSEIVKDPHVVARQLFFDLPSPWGDLLQMRLPITPRDMTHRPPPKQGEHTDEILREAGLSDEEIAAMRADGAAR
ncbi:MAG: CaiB/BaiF CoA-transferase family protein, partial [Polyangiaceae bacterium]